MLKKLGVITSLAILSNINIGYSNEKIVNEEKNSEKSQMKDDSQREKKRHSSPSLKIDNEYNVNDDEANPEKNKRSLSLPQSKIEQDELINNLDSKDIVAGLSDKIKQLQVQKKEIKTLIENKSKEIHELKSQLEKVENLLTKNVNQVTELLLKTY